MDVEYIILMVYQGHTKPWFIKFHNWLSTIAIDTRNIKR